MYIGTYQSYWKWNFLILWQIFQQVTEEKSSTAAFSSSYGIPEVQLATPKGVQLDCRSRDRSAAGAAARLVSFRKDHLGLPLPAPNGEIN